MRGLIFQQKDGSFRAQSKNIKYLFNFVNNILTKYKKKCILLIIQEEKYGKFND